MYFIKKLRGKYIKHSSDDIFIGAVFFAVILTF